MTVQYSYSGKLIVQFTLTGREGGIVRVSRCGDDAAFFEGGPNVLVRNDGPCMLDAERIGALIDGLTKIKAQIDRANDEEMLARNRELSEQGKL